MDQYIHLYPSETVFLKIIASVYPNNTDSQGEVEHRITGRYMEGCNTQKLAAYSEDLMSPVIMFFPLTIIP